MNYKVRLKTKNQRKEVDFEDIKKAREYYNKYKSINCYAELVSVDTESEIILESRNEKWN